MSSDTLVPRKELYPEDPIEKKQRRVAELEKEIDELRAAIGNEPTTLSVWLESAPQGVRDAMAAKAFLQSYGNLDAAMKLLGFKFKKGEKKLFFGAVRQVLQTEGCHKIIDQDLSDFHQQFPHIIERMSRIARFGGDAEAVRAAQVFGKLTGLQKTPDTVNIHNDNRQELTLQQIIHGEARPRQEKEADIHEVSASEFLSHMPGDAIRVTVGVDTIDEAIEALPPAPGIADDLYDG